MKCQRCFPHFPGCKELEINAIAFMHYCCHIEHYINFTRIDNNIKIRSFQTINRKICKKVREKVSDAGVVVVDVI